ncbi:MAG TPA: DUF1579 domain-containing protein, partial [Ramlibacter sp.]|nr:DUF1579 domain-containing protein [Ramlibacter sp.]
MALQARVDAPGDFDFIIGEWEVFHRRLAARLSGCTEWTEFKGRTSTSKILGGHGNLEDNLLYLPEGEVRAVALRSFDESSGTWSIWWLDARKPMELDTPVRGGFDNGIGTFYAESELNGQPVRVRFKWITPQAGARFPVWEQAFS